jgi:hypothetical protein
MGRLVHFLSLKKLLLKINYVYFITSMTLNNVNQDSRLKKFF